MAHLLDPPFFGMPGAEHYRHQTFPDSFLNGKEIRIENWYYDPLLQVLYTLQEISDL